MNSFDIVSRLPYVVVMLLMTCHAVSASSENLRGNELATSNNQTLGMVYYDYDYEVGCNEENYNRFNYCTSSRKTDLQEKWVQVWVKAPGQDVAISGVLSSYGLFVNYFEGGRLDWSGTLMIGASTFPYTKVDGEYQYCKEEDVPVNNQIYGYTGQRKDDVIDHDRVICSRHGRIHEGASSFFFRFVCQGLINRNDGQNVPVWSFVNCYYKTLDDVKYMTRLLTPEQVMSCYGESGLDLDRVC